MTQLHTLDAATLTEHSDWMRGLARRLVFASDQVDDLVQDAWAAALQNPPREGVSLRAWLTGIMKRRALQGRRRAGNEGARERATATAEAIRSTEELASFADEQRFLIERVLALPEIYREVLLLRFYEGLAPKDIAARLDQPVGTVKTRTQRGLERLRSELDERHGGDRQRWCLALAPLGAMPLGTKVGAAGTGVLGSFAWWKLGACAAAIALAVMGALRSFRSPELLDLRQTTSVDALGEALFARAVGPRSKQPADRALGNRTAVRAAATDRLLRGIVVDQYGEPVAGAAVRTDSPPDANGNPRPGVWYSDSVLSREDGTFAFEPAEDGQGVFVSATLDGYLQKQGTVQLGADGQTSVEIHRLGTTRMEIEVVDKDSGRAVPRFSAYAGAALEGYPDRVSQWKNVGSGHTMNGRWSEDVGLIPGEELRVYLVSCFGFPGRQHHVNVMPTEDGVTKVRFEVSALQDKDGPGEANPVRRWVQGRAVDDVTGEPVPGVSITVYGGPGKGVEMELTRAQSLMDGTFRAPLMEGGTGTSIGVEHPGYRSELAPMEGVGDVEIRLLRRATLSGRVLGEGGEELAGAPLLFLSTRLNEGTRSKLDRVHVRSFTDSEGRFEFPNLVGGRYTLCVCRGPRDADENALLRESISVAPGESKEITVELARPERVHVTGTVRPPVGPPVGPQPKHELVPVFLPYGDGAWLQAKATDWGFDAGGVDRGTYLVVLMPADDEHSPGPFGLLPGVVVEGFGQTRFDFAYPENVVRGRVVGLGPEGGQGYSVVASPVLPPGFAADFLATGKLNRLFAQDLEADGTFRVGRLADGEHRLSLYRGETEVASQVVHVAGSQTLADWRPPLAD